MGQQAFEELIERVDPGGGKQLTGEDGEEITETSSDLEISIFYNRKTPPSTPLNDAIKNLQDDGVFSSEEAAALMALPGPVQKIKEGPPSRAFGQEDYREEEQKTPSVTEHLINQAKLGFAFTPAVLEALIDTFVIDPIKQIPSANFGDTIDDFLALGTKEGLGNFLGQVGRQFTGNLDELQKVAADVTGADPTLEAPGDISRYAGAAVFFASDPLVFIGKPMQALRQLIMEGGPAAKAAAELTYRALPAGVIGMSAEGGGDAGAKIEHRITGNDTGLGRSIGAISAALGAAFSIAPGRTLLQTAKEPVVKVTKNVTGAVYNRLKGIPVDLVAAEKASMAKSAQRFLKSAVEAGGGRENLKSIINEYRLLRTYAYKTGVKDLDKQLPLLFVLSDNPVVMARAQELMRKSPLFRARVQHEIAEVSKLINNNSVDLFGQPFAKIASQAELSNIQQKALKSAHKKAMEIETRIQQLTESLRPLRTEQQIGRAVEREVLRKQRVARAAHSILYKSLRQQAAQNNITMPVEGVKMIWDFVKNNRLLDIFGVTSKVEGRILSVLAPKETKVAALDSAGNIVFSPGTKTPVLKTVRRHKEITFAQVESLKKRINQALYGGKLTADEERKLLQLKAVVKDARTTMPGTYSAQLEAIDKQYFNQVGLPWGQPGILEIGSARYSEQVSSIVLLNRTALQDFLAVAATDVRSTQKAYKIVEDAAYSHIHHTMVKEGKLDTRMLEAFIHRKDSVISLIPNLRGNLTKLLSEQGELFLRLKTINGQLEIANKRIADNFLISANYSPLAKGEGYGTKPLGRTDYQKIVRNLSTDPKLRQTLIGDLKSLDFKTAEAVRENLRQGLITIASQEAETMKFLTAPQNAELVNLLAGKAHLTRLKRVARLVDSLHRANPEKLAHAARSEELAKIAGVPIPFLTSAARNPIMGMPHKVLRVLSKWYDVNMGAKADRAIMELLLDPKGMQKLERIALTTPKNLDVKGVAERAFRRFGGVLGELIPLSIYAGVKEGLSDQGTYENMDNNLQ